MKNVLFAVGKVLFAGLFILAGVMHFVNAEFFLNIMPPYLPWHLEIVYISGVIEILLGIMLLIPRFERLAGWGLVALLIAVFPANIHVFLHQELVPAPYGVHVFRLILQGVLILWAWAYTQRGSRDGRSNVDQAGAGGS